MAKAKKKKASVKGEKRFSKIRELRAFEPHSSGFVGDKAVIKIQWVPDSMTIPLETQEPPPLLNRDRYSKVGV